MIIYNALQSYIRGEYWKRGYVEVNSPNMFNSALWKQSGHWQHYKDDMFTFDVEKEGWALKPMNCPGHCLLFGHRERSYRELPIRMAEFGILHRNEASGALTGLTRVRRFMQDDTHIFCMGSQIEQEIKGLFDLLSAVYGLFGFPFKMKLSTMPDNHLGDAETNTEWELNPGDGAFYGPKIDITISDALKREYQCATIQLDFQLPQQFNLEYRTEEQAGPREQVNGEAAEKSKAADGEPKPEQKDKLVIRSAPPAEPDSSAVKKEEGGFRRELTPGCARPVMIHRAIYGSFERFIAILCEHFAGKWPFWLSPRQILIVPVMPAVNDYVLELQQLFREQRMHVDVDISGNTMQKKIRTGQLQQYNFIFVVGAQEKEKRSVNIRNRDDTETQKLGELIPVDEAIRKLGKLRDERRLESGLSGL
ncbi:threonyl-tRNA synthetase [Friedmanniomyces endolithicus]|uniref:threonine--tRNA ligase n=1 Tax=Friedmanniomyces endolithicus TaxID=329885 RepID=A0AAN6GXQ9_9PEZI|nr:threonyl-tRNA synthetase [Friedmanniomyces endolithicus]